MSIQSVPFEAQWSDTTIHLANPPTTTIGKVKKIALDFFSILIPPIGLARIACYGASRIARRMTLPAAFRISQERFLSSYNKFHEFWYGPITEENEKIRTFYSLEHRTVVTPDGASLKAMCMRHKDSTSDTPTIIYFCSNFQLSVETPITSVLSQALEENVPCNAVLFDYRSVGESKGEFKHAKDLAIDGSSIVEWVKRGIGTRPERIHFYGYSLGGAVATITKSLDPENLTGKLISDRSFASSSHIVASRYGKGYFGTFLDYLFKRNGFSADAAEAFAKASGEKLILYLPNDLIIPFEASMQCAVRHDLAICLSPKADFEDLSKQRNHASPLHWFELAIEKVVEFLFPSRTET